MERALTSRKGSESLNISSAPMSQGLNLVVKRYTLLSSNDAMEAKLPAVGGKVVRGGSPSHLMMEAGVEDTAA
jgi:hypothetical protein